VKVVSIVARCAIVAIVALACGELYARCGSVDRSDTTLFKSVSDANTEMGRLGALDLGPTRVGAQDWFADEPPPLKLASGSGATTFPHLDRRAADPSILSITGLNFPRVYNHAFVTRSVCDNREASLFRRLPHELFVFEPRNGELDPAFRFYPDARYPSGMRTNSLGYRSPEIVPTRQRDVVRVAFVGSSTVVGHPRAPLATPEYVMHWLSRWAGARGWDVRFDYVTAAREGLGTKQVTEVLAREVAPLKPDIVIFWGFESFDFRGFVTLPDGVVFGHPPKRDWVGAVAAATGTTWIAEKSALLRLISASLADPFDPKGLAREPAKPAYERRFPSDFSESAPRFGKQVPPAVAGAYVDLDQFIGAVRALGALPILIADQYAAYDGAVIAADRSTRDPILSATVNGVYGYLNEAGLWPITYADQRGILEYQTHLFQGLATKRNVAFVDLLTDRKLDTALFLDGVHLTPLGMKLTGWWMFQEMAPTIEAYLRTRQTRELRVSDEDVAYLTQRPQRIDAKQIDCSPPRPADEVAGSYLLSAIVQSYSKAQVVKRDVPVIKTSPEPSTYAAAVPVQAKSVDGLRGKGWVGVRARVIEGRVAVGVLNKTAQRFLASVTVSASPDVQEIYLIVDDLSQIGDLMISNGRSGETAVSIAELHGVVLKRFR
jgi:hypothetical protein